MRQQFIIIALAVLVVAAIAAGGYYYYSSSGRALMPPPGTPPPAGEAGPTRITEADNGKSFTYGQTERFSVVLDAMRYNQEFLACSPGGAVGVISNAPSVEPPLAASSFEAVIPGTCVLRNGDFAVTLTVFETSE